MGFEISGLDEMTEALKQVQDTYPQEVKKFMQSGGNKVKKQNCKDSEIIGKTAHRQFCERHKTRKIL